MKDYSYNGRPVSQMLDRDIAECLKRGVEMLPGSSETEEDVLQRLRLEQFIRARRLR